MTFHTVCKSFDSQARLSTCFPASSVIRLRGLSTPAVALQLGAKEAAGSVIAFADPPMQWHNGPSSISRDKR